MPGGATLVGHLRTNEPKRHTSVMTKNKCIKLSVMI